MGRMSPAATVAHGVLQALGLDDDPKAVRLVLACWARPVRRLSVGEVFEILRVVDRRGDDHYDRPADPPGTHGAGRPWRGPRYSEPEGVE